MEWLWVSAIALGIAAIAGIVQLERSGFFDKVLDVDDIIRGGGSGDHQQTS